MPILETPFTCPNGHAFTANAKLRTRCPDCGVMARRNFEPDTKPKEDPKPVIDGTTDKKPVAVKGPVLLRQGRVMPTRKTAKPAAPAKKPTAAPKKRTVTKASGGLLKSHPTAPKGTVPRITKRPPRTAVARHVESGEKKPFWERVKDQMWG